MNGWTGYWRTVSGIGGLYDLQQSERVCGMYTPYDASGRERQEKKKQFKGRNIHV